MLPLSIILLIVFCFFILQPTVQTLMLPKFRTYLVNRLLINIITNKHIDPQMFWRTREFASQGSFHYEHDGFAPHETGKLTKEFGINSQQNPYLFLKYTSDDWPSVEGLTQAQTLDGIFSTAKKQNKLIVLHNQHELVYYENPRQLRIVFVKSIEDMKKANGFLDYNGYDKELVKDRFWLCASIIKL